MRRFVNHVTFLMVLCLIGAGGPVQAGLKSSVVQYRQGETVLHGYLVHDDAIRTKRPGVLVVHEWWGLNDHARAAAEALAKAGYVALAVDMYGEGKNTDHPKRQVNGPDLYGRMTGSVRTGLRRHIRCLRIIPGSMRIGLRPLGTVSAATWF